MKNLPPIAGLAPALLGLIFGLIFGPVVSASAAEQPAVPPAHSKQMARSLALFNSEVRPLLKRNCINCHGGEKIRGGLNLNTREGLLEGGDNGPAAIPGDSRESLLVALIEHREEPFMPKSDEKVLDTEQISSFARWIDTGAAYSKPILNPEQAAASDGPMTVTEEDRNFWSFRPLSKPAPPQKYNAAWSRNAIDDFVAEKHEAVGLRPNPEADPRKLIRRLHFDLIGLPPTPNEVDAFLAAWRRNPDAALEQTIDRLLASPRHGEKWARHWLDVARFAESHGFEQDYDRPYAYHYRDFVIRAFNEDMPYDQFVKWQLAGDEFAPDNPLAMMATGFLGAGVFPTQLTEKEFESARYDELDDMAATTGTAFLGLTIGCARCHDHKYDPIPVRDYYRLVSTFTTTIRSEIDIDLEPGAYEKKKAAWAKEDAPLAVALERYENGPLNEKFEAHLENGTLPDPSPVAWHPLDPVAYTSREGATLTKLDDASLLASGENPKTDDYTITSRTSAKGITALRIEALTHHTLRKNGPGRARNGNFALSNLTIRSRPLADKKAELADVAIVSAVATHEQNDGTLSAKSVFDNNLSATGWAVDKGGIGSDQAIVITLEKPIAYPGGAEIVLMLKFANNTQHSLGRARISFSTEAQPPVLVGNDLPYSVSDAAFALRKNGASPDLSKEQRATLEHWHARSDPRWRELNAAVAAHRATEPQPTLVKVQITGEGYPKTKHHADGRGFPHFYPSTYHLTRGDVFQKGEIAEPGFLQVLLRDEKHETRWQDPPPSDARFSGRRSALANWITDTEHGAGHLLARVIVNRLWHHHFGRGIVATPSDFGLQGMRPSHPELLDYLAGELIRNGWRLKPIHKQILLSATWRQSGTPNPAMARLDPENRYLWRFAPRRLEAENLRDSLLSLSGQLDETMFGPGSLEAGNPRRSIYLFIKRSQLIPMMQVFDTPEPLVGQGSRPSTTIAPQALVLMNNANVRRWINGFAQRIDTAAPHSLEKAITEGYRIALGRSPTALEHRDATVFLEDQLVDYKHAARTDARILALGDLCQVLVSLNEFAYIE